MKMRGQNIKGIMFWERIYGFDQMLLSTSKLTQLIYLDISFLAWISKLIEVLSYQLLILTAETVSRQSVFHGLSKCLMDRTE